MEWFIELVVDVELFCEFIRLLSVFQIFLDPKEDVDKDSYPKLLFYKLLPELFAV